jgi:chorismate mutase
MLDIVVTPPLIISSSFHIYNLYFFRNRSTYTDTKDKIAAIIFSTTADLNAAFPAEAARHLGWIYVPLFCTSEINVPGALPRCIRILMLVNSTKTQEEIKHVYLGGTSSLRADL